MRPATRELFIAFARLSASREALHVLAGGQSNWRAELATALRARRRETGIRARLVAWWTRGMVDEYTQWLISHRSTR